jgi:geranylgeranyl pyrophosphate synthase
MDALVPQRDGFRFMYALPLARDRVLVEDTYFSGSPELHSAEIEGEILAYAERSGMAVRGVARRESGVLPLPTSTPPMNEPEPDAPLQAGYQGGWFHPTTGYSLRRRRAPAARLARSAARAALAAALRRLTQPAVLYRVRRRRALSGDRTLLSPAGGVDPAFLRVEPQPVRSTAADVWSTTTRFLFAAPAERGFDARRRSVMTQPLPMTARAAEPRQKPEPEAGAGALPQLIRDELAEPRLMRTLDSADQRVHERYWNASLSGPLLELLERDGNYFRSRLVEVAFELASRGAAGPMPERLSLLVEVLHAGSLIIDDIEDDAKYRRGGPALHLLVGVPLALNAGNWLYFLPHRLLEDLDLAPMIELEVRRAIDRSVLRCHYGQALDLGVRLDSLAQAEVFDVVSLSTRLKTGSLFELAAEIGAIAGGASAELRAALVSFARSYGVALQMLDDTSGLYQVGRAHKAHEDLLNSRPTWPWAWLSLRLDELGYSRLQHQAQATARRELHPEALATALRRQLGDAPHRAVHRELVAAFQRLERQVQSSRLLAPLAEELARLEKAYG